MKNSTMVLVTGATGAVGSNCILQLLQKGYAVRATLRNMIRKNEVLEMLQNNGIEPQDRLSFVEADLESDAGWAAAMQGCQYVLQVASPTHIASKDESATIRPAVEGVLRVLKAARDAGVKRVVLTSSFGALGFSNHDRHSVTTEACWTDPNEKGLSAYEKSKGLAERAAWDFMKKQGAGMELAVINPVAIFGPLPGPGKPPSFGLLKMLLSGSMKAVPDFPLNVVDIRDVADLHIRAMITPQAAGERFIATADGEISLPQIARLLSVKLPAISGKVSQKILPPWLLRMASLFNKEAQSALLFTRVNRRVSNAKAKKILGWTPIATNEETILASVHSMVKFGMIP